jgi:hypothetical protein
VALLGDLVRHVFLLRTEKKMIGIYAGANVATMADQQAFGDRAAMHGPRRTMGLPVTALEVDSAIAVGRTASGPQNAACFWIANAPVLEPPPLPIMGNGRPIQA